MNAKLTPEQRAEVNVLLEAAQDDLEQVLFTLVAQREALRDVLLDLHAVQNGPPLEKYRKDWEAAMQRAALLLSNAELSGPATP